MDCWNSLGRDVGEKFRNSGKQGTGPEKFILSADFGSPFIIGDWQLRPVEELKDTLICAVS